MYDTSPEMSLQVVQDDKFFSRLISKESSMANPSFRVYHGGLSGAVPFMWESQPGTPKHASCESSLPPLTPPPSYYFNSTRKPTKNHTRSNLLQFLFPKISQRKTNVSNTNSPTSLSSSSSSSSSSPSRSSTKNYGRRSKFSSRGLSFDSRMDDEEEEAARSSPTSTLCFGIGKGLRSQRQHQHCY